MSNDDASMMQYDEKEGHLQRRSTIVVLGALLERALLAWYYSATVVPKAQHLEALCSAPAFHQGLPQFPLLRPWLEAPCVASPFRAGPRKPDMAKS